MITIGIYVQEKDALKLRQWGIEQWAEQMGCKCRLYEKDFRITEALCERNNIGMIIRYRGESSHTIKKLIENYVLKESRSKRIYQVTVERAPYILDLNDIIYFESQKRKMIAYGCSQSVSFYQSMTELERNLADKGFVRCHRSFMVNADYVDELHRTQLIADGRKIPVGREYYENREDKGIWNRLSKWNSVGTLIGIGGSLDGVIFRIRPDAELIIGSDAIYADIVIGEPDVCLEHCVVRFSKKDRSYYLYNRSSMVVKINDDVRLPAGGEVRACKGDIFCIGKNQAFQVG